MNRDSNGIDSGLGLNHGGEGDRFEERERVWVLFVVVGGVSGFEWRRSWVGQRSWVVVVLEIDVDDGGIWVLC